MKEENLKPLIEKYLRGEATPEEAAIVEQWYGQVPDELDITITAAAGETEASLEAKMLQRLQKRLYLKDSAQKAPVRRLLPGWAAAAAIILVLLVGTQYFYNREEALPVPVAGAETIISSPQEIKPGGNRAQLQLADGRTILLDSASNGLLARQGTTNINLLADGQLAYQQAGITPETVSYNTLTTPKGGQYQITLPDGTKVWLNAISSIHFPTAFTGKERQVRITGEAYFEVAADPSRPFKVQFGEAEITVLGTHFNINAYTDEKDAKATLLEGLIQIQHKNQAQKLVPGQQARLHSQGMQVVSGANTEEATAWKDGYFVFASTDMETLLRQAARWYNIDVSFQGPIPPDRFTGKISRNVNLSQFLSILEYSEVHFKMEGRKLIL